MESVQNNSSPSSALTWLGVAIATITLAIFYLFVPGFGRDQSQSPLAWLRSAWNPETQLEYGFLVPCLMLGLFIWQRKALKESVSQSSRWGLPTLFIGIVLFFIAHRTGQVRFALVGLPWILWGSIWFLWGWKTARLSFIPLFLFLLAIPFPQLHPFDSNLQILSTKLAQAFTGWVGVETEARGASISSSGNHSNPLDLGGCGGSGTLICLLVIVTAWSYLARLAPWKQFLMILSVVPIEIFGNALRLASIFVINEHGSPEFARSTWYDWSGLIVFYPTALILLFTIHCLLKGGLPNFKQWLAQYRNPTEGSSSHPAHQIRRRFFILPLLLAVSLSSVFVLPPVRNSPSALSVEIPTFLGDWQTQTYPSSQKESAILQGNSSFIKAKCGLKRWEETSHITGVAPTDIAELSIVHSGSRSPHPIHRPELALVVQGHSNLKERASELTLANGRVIPLRRILSKRTFHDGTQYDALIYSLSVGHSSITANRFEQSLINFFDQTFKGQDQQWAGIHVSMHYVDQTDPPFGGPLNLETTDKKLRNLVAALMENNVDWSMIGK